MITITNIMHVNGSKTDLYSPSYFKKVEGVRDAVSPFARWTDGSIFAFGSRTNELGTINVVVDLIIVNDTVVPLSVDLGDDPVATIESVLNENEGLITDAFVNSPVIPPSKSYTDWKYTHQVERQTISYFLDGEWHSKDLLTTWYYSGNDKLVPVLSDDYEAQANKHYYYLDKWSVRGKEVFVSLDVKPGDKLRDDDDGIGILDIIAGEINNRCSARSISISTSDLKLYEVDVTKATVVDTDTESVPEIMGYWLGKLTSFIQFTSVDQDTSKIVASYGSVTEPNMEGDFEYRHSLHDAVFTIKDPFADRKQILPICNGLFCFPKVVNNKVYGREGQRLSYNEQDRNRRWVLADFSQVGGASFKQLSDFEGPLSELIVTNVNPSEQSVLLVVRGRLFTNDEFDLVQMEDGSCRLLFDLTKYTGICELDRMVCRGDFKNNSKILDPNKHVKRSVGSATFGVIDDYAPTTDTEFVEGKEYYVKFHEDFVLAQVTVGAPIGLQHVYAVGIKDETNQHVSMVHDSEGNILFNEFYEKTLVQSRTVNTEVEVSHIVPEVDLKNDVNSFIIVINKPGLRVIRHECFEGPRPFTKMKLGSDTHVGTMRVTLDRQVRGLLFDTVTRSVIDYTRETQSLTFYADKFRKWGIANVSANWSSLLAVTDESADNSMSTKGYILDRCDSDKYDHVVWPHLTILDFVFKD